MAEAAFEIWFDFIRHQSVLETSDGLVKTLALAPCSVAEFYQEFMEMLQSREHRSQNLESAGRNSRSDSLDQDSVHAAYDPETAWKNSGASCWRWMRSSTGSGRDSMGKCSPVHFFWGSFDLAVTRFSGRPAPAARGRPIMREAYSHEVISVGFWPGSGPIADPAFYSYAAPEPQGFREAQVRPGGCALRRTGERIHPDV